MWQSLTALSRSAQLVTKMIQEDEDITKDATIMGRTRRNSWSDQIIAHLPKKTTISSSTVPSR